MATIDPENEASRKVLLKCGLRETGLFRAYGETIPRFVIGRGEWMAKLAAKGEPIPRRA